jgi:hypothetical protein
MVSRSARRKKVKRAKRRAGDAVCDACPSTPRAKLQIQGKIEKVSLTRAMKILKEKRRQPPTVFPRKTFKN